MSIPFGPLPIEVAPRDLLWVGLRPVSDLEAIFRDPVEAIKIGQKKLLKDPYVVRVESLNAGGELKGNVLVQGVDGGNLITVQAEPGTRDAFLGFLKVAASGDDRTGIHSISAFAPFGAQKLARIAADVLEEALEIEEILSREPNANDLPPIEEFYITIVLDEDSDVGKAFIHFELIKIGNMAPGDYPLKKSLTITGHHLAQLRDPTYFHRIVLTFQGKVKPVFKRCVRGKLEDIGDPGHAIEFVQPKEPIPLTYIGEQDSTAPACEILVAMYREGKISYEQAYCKAYA